MIRHDMRATEPSVRAAWCASQMIVRSNERDFISHGPHATRSKLRVRLKIYQVLRVRKYFGTQYSHFCASHATNGEPRLLLLLLLLLPLLKLGRCALFLEYIGLLFLHDAAGAYPVPGILYE